MHVLRRSAVAAFALGALSSAAASPHVVAFSTSTHFSCANAASPSATGLCVGSETAAMGSSAAADILGFLSTGSASVSALPSLSARFATPTTSPELVLAVTERAGLASDVLLGRLATSVGSTDGKASSFAAELDVAAPGFEGTVRSTAEIVRMAESGHALFSDGKIDVLNVEVNSVKKRDDILNSMRQLAQRTSGKFALVWTTARVDEQTAGALESAVQGGDAGNAAAPAADALPRGEELGAEPLLTDGAGTAEGAEVVAGMKANTTANAEFNADGSLKKKTHMDPPPITPGIAVGLIVAFILLLILMPGMMCLYNIQAPQSFEITDKDDAKKKMQ